MFTQSCRTSQRHHLQHHRHHCVRVHILVQHGLHADRHSLREMPAQRNVVVHDHTHVLGYDAIDVHVCYSCSCTSLLTPRTSSPPQRIPARLALLHQHMVLSVAPLASPLARRRMHAIRGTRLVALQQLRAQLVPLGALLPRHALVLNCHSLHDLKLVTIRSLLMSCVVVCTCSQRLLHPCDTCQRCCVPCYWHHR